MTTILLVEDSQDLNRALALRLQSAGYEIVRAYDAVQATTLARKHTPDLALLDINLPGGDGFTVAERLQNMTALPVIFITANRNPTLEATAKRAGAAAFLSKPFTADDLLQAIGDALANNEEQSTFG